MKINIEIDSGSGFCYGVIRAVEKAENNLAENNTLYSLGAIVHNNSELERLNNKGLIVIDNEQMKNISNTKVLIRAHGEPPATYALAKQNNIKLIDCTCPVVLKLQERIKKSYSNGDCQIVIFGKIGHAEVNGLVGQVNGDAIIIDNDTPLDKIDFKKPISIFSQTTKDPTEYDKICNIIRNKIIQSGGSVANFKVNNTICKQVAQRHNNLVSFAQKHTIIIFVSGKESSNGKVLYNLCKSVNQRSYNIQNFKQIQIDWFKENDSIGICGATSTPKWQLEGIRDYLMELLTKY